jgi:hypothetical protein
MGKLPRLLLNCPKKEHFRDSCQPIETAENLHRAQLTALEHDIQRRQVVHP